MLYLDLDELDELNERLSRFACNGRALVSFHEADHGPRDGSALKPWIEGLLSRAGVDLDGGAVRILSIPRVFGGKFYPVSFWYCFHADGTLRAILAEVQNTFGDHHSYLLHDSGAPMSWESRPMMPKAFYISPFIPIENVRHHFAFTEPGDTISASVNDHIDGKLVLTTNLSLSAEELSDANLLRAVLRMGPMSARALLLIHWQALRLVLKRVPFLMRNSPPAEEVSL